MRFPAIYRHKFQKYSLQFLPCGPPRSHGTKQLVKNWIFGGKTVVGRSAWIKAWTHIFLFQMKSKCKCIFQGNHSRIVNQIYNRCLAWSTHWFFRMFLRRKRVDANVLFTFTLIAGDPKHSCFWLKCTKPNLYFLPTVFVETLFLL